MRGKEIHAEDLKKIDVITAPLPRINFSLITNINSDN
jgi:hypothetical protein